MKLCTLPRVIDRDDHVAGPHAIGGQEFDRFRQRQDAITAFGQQRHALLEFASAEEKSVSVMRSRTDPYSVIAKDAQSPACQHSRQRKQPEALCQT